MTLLEELTAPPRLASAVAVVLAAVSGFAYWLHQRWVGNVDADLRGKAGKGDVERVAEEVAALEQRSVTAAQDLAVAVHDVIDLRRGSVELRQELADLLDRLYRLEHRQALADAAGVRLDQQLAELRQRMETGEPP